MSNMEKLILTFYAEDYAVEDIRLVCKKGNNIWDYRIDYNDINKGYNSFEISKNQFTSKR